MAAEQRSGINLNDLAQRLKRAVAAGATAPLVLAPEVARLASVWSEYRDEAGGVDLSTWLKRVCGKGWTLSWWLGLNESVEVIGEASRRILDYRVARWLIGKLKDPQELERAVSILRFEQKRNHGIPATKKMAERALRAEKLIPPATHQKCNRCRLLEKVIRELGGEVPE